MFKITIVSSCYRRSPIFVSGKFSNTYNEYFYCNVVVFYWTYRRQLNAVNNKQATDHGGNDYNEDSNEDYAGDSDLKLLLK